MNMNKMPPVEEQKPAFIPVGDELPISSTSSKSWVQIGRASCRERV